MSSGEGRGKGPPGRRRLVGHGRGKAAGKGAGSNAKSK